MEHFVLLINATTIACEKFITVTFYNSAANNIVIEIFLL